MEFKTLNELKKHIKQEHSLHYTSELTQEYFRAMELKEKVKTKKVEEKPKTKPKSKAKGKKKK